MTPVARALAACLLLSCLTVASQAQPVRADSLRADSLHGPTAWHRADGFDALPIRSVRGIAAWAPGVRRDLATGALTTRAGPGPQFVVDGVRQLDGVEVPFEAVQRVRVWTEGVPARYGEAANGLVSVDTESALDRFGGRLEAYSSRATDAYGADLGALSLRGPLGTLGGFELAGEIGRQLDAMPTGIGAVQLTDEAFARVQASPQSVLIEEGGVQRSVPFPFEAVAAAPGTFTDADLRGVLGLAPDAIILQLVPTVETLGADAFERRAAADNPLDDLRLAAGLTLRPAAGLSLRTTARLDRQRAERSGSPIQQFASALMNPDGLSTTERNGFGLATTLSHTVSSTLRYSLRASVENDAFVSHPIGFSDQLEDVLLYGDIDDPSADVAQRYVVRSFDGYRQQFTQDSGARPGRVGFDTYSLPGRPSPAQYAEGEDRSIQVGGTVHLALGAHQLELGAEMEQQTHRLFAIRGFGLAASVDDGSLEQAAPEGFPNGVTADNQFAYSFLRNRTTYYGTTYNGLAAADGEDIDAFYDNDLPGSAKDIAPFQPRTMAGFAEATSSFGPLTTRFGLRLQGYDANANILVDPYAPLPIRRAGDLTTPLPDGIGDDYALYFGADETTVVGYRDLDGRFYDALGTSTTSTSILVDQQASVLQKEGALRSEAFRDAATLWSVEPRLHIELAATEALRLFASAERLSKTPDAALHVPLSTFDNLASLGFGVGSVAPEFETVDAARLGLSAIASSTVTASAAGFVRQTRGIPILRPLDGSFPRYGATLHEGALDEIGVDVMALWVPSPAASVQFAYTLASAKGSSASSSAVTNIIWRASPGDSFPTLEIASENDTRHAIDLVASGRIPSEGFSALGGIGGGIVLSAQSGLPYTRLAPNPGFSVGEGFTAEALGSINSARLPWTHQIDVRLDKQIAIGPSTVELFAWVQNVLGTENVLAVYRSTGLPDDDGYLATRVDGTLTPEQQALYRAYISGPVNVGGNQSTVAPYMYGQPRQIRLGLRASF